MRVTKYRPFRNTASIDQLFDNFFGTQLSEFIGGEFTSSTPGANITEIEEGYNIELAIPGVSKEDVQILVEKDTLIVKAEKTSEKDDSYQRREFNFSSFERKFFLSEDIDQEKISAKHENGILSISLTKDTTTPEKKTVVIE